MREVRIQLPSWKKGMTVGCDKCMKRLKAPYLCEKCQIKMRPFIKLDFGG